MIGRVRHDVFVLALNYVHLHPPSSSAPRTRWRAQRVGEMSAELLALPSRLSRKRVFHVRGESNVESKTSVSPSCDFMTFSAMLLLAAPAAVCRNYTDRIN